MQEVIDRLTLGVCDLSLEEVKELMRVYHIKAGRSQTVVIPVEMHISMILSMKISTERNRIMVFDRFYSTKVGHLETAYRELETARKAIPVLKDQFLRGLM